MAEPPLYPLRFEPILKRILWGGRRLGAVLGKRLGDHADYAESWEVSDYRNDVSRVAEGPLAGKSLRELLRERGAELVGPHLAPLAQFPLLVKFLDANQVLSVQVHPDDALGRVLANDNGKTEAWVIVHAEPGSLIYAGLRAGVTKHDLEQAMDSGEVEPLLHRFEAKPGDCIMIPAGAVHAIGAGVLLAEIQQMSDATFRIYDWGRVGPDGKPRQLHKQEALASTDFHTGPVNPLIPREESIEGGVRETLARCRYFAIDRLRLHGVTRAGSRDRFTLLLGLGGSAEIRHDGRSFPLQFGQTLLLPAACGEVSLEPNAAETVVLTCIIPDAP